MINSETKQQIMKALGKQYSRKILPALEKKGIRSSQGNPYNMRMLQHLMAGRGEDLKVERAIYQLIRREELRRDNLERLKNATLKGNE